MNVLHDRKVFFHIIHLIDRVNHWTTILTLSFQMDETLSTFGRVDFPSNDDQTWHETIVVAGTNDHHEPFQWKSQEQYDR